MTRTIEKTPPIQSWLPIIGLAFAAFVFNTSEFLPVGLLPEIAECLNESVSFTGLIITGYAWVVALMSLPLTLATASLERKKLLVFLIACFAASHIAVLWATTFEYLLVARVAVALTHSVFWSIMTPLAARMAPEGRYGLGLAVVMCGTVVATVMGLPIGTKLGHLFGWQEAFAVIGLAAVLLMGFIALFLPPCPATSAGSVKSLPVILKRPPLLQLYGLTAVAVLGNYTVYSFIAPILQTVGSCTASDTVFSCLSSGLGHHRHNDCDKVCRPSRIVIFSRPARRFSGMSGFDCSRLRLVCLGYVSFCCLGSSYHGSDDWVSDCSFVGSLRCG